MTTEQEKIKALEDKLEKDDKAIQKALQLLTRLKEQKEATERELAELKQANAQKSQEINNALTGAEQKQTQLEANIVQMGNLLGVDLYSNS